MQFDVVVAGAGIIGSSIAWRLAQVGMRVILLDAGRMGGEASSAGAGMLAPGGEIAERSAWSDFALESLRLYPDFVAELESESGLKIDFQREGAVEVALSAAECDPMLARSRAQEALGIRSSRLPLPDLRKLIPLACPDVAAAWFYPDDAVVDPRDIMAALRSACERRHATIAEGTRVEKIQAEGRSALVFTDAGTFQTPAAVLAAGAWSSQIPVEGTILPESFPVRGHLIGFHLEPGSLGPIVRHGHMYLLQRASGFTIAGTSSEEVGFNRTLDAGIVEDIHSRTAALIPALAKRKSDEHWLGFRPGIASGGPALGRAEETALWLAYGHYRNGILLAPATAARIAAGITASSGRGSSAPTGRR